MIDTLKTLLLQVLTMSPKGVGLSGKLQTNPRKNSLTLSTLRESNVSQKDSFQQRWSQIFLLD